MAIVEQSVAKGYAALKKETTKGTAVTPNVYVPYYDQSIASDIHLITDTPVYGNKFGLFQNLQGLRSHGGSLTVMAEPNTAGYWHDMLASKISTTGSSPYTHLFGASNTADPNSYTVDISFGLFVVRYFGVEASKITYGWDNQEMKLSLDVSALGSFPGAEISSISTTTVVLKTDRDPAPTTGLVASDLVYVIKSDGTTLSTTISSITNGTTVVLGASAASFAAGDMLVLRPATPSLSLLTPFLWGKTQFCFGVDAATALAATQTRLDDGTEISLMNAFNNDEGEPRSGGFDPASLIRTTYSGEAKIKKFLTPDEFKYWNAITKRALVMRAYSGATSQYELRVTLNNMKALTNEVPTESGGVVYHEVSYSPEYDQTDAQGFDVKVINAVATV